METAVTAPSPKTGLCANEIQCSSTTKSHGAAPLLSVGPAPPDPPGARGDEDGEMEKWELENGRETFTHLGTPALAGGKFKGIFKIIFG